MAYVDDRGILESIERFPARALHLLHFKAERIVRRSMMIKENQPGLKTRARRNRVRKPRAAESSGAAAARPCQSEFIVELAGLTQDQIVRETALARRAQANVATRRAIDLLK